MTIPRMYFIVSHDQHPELMKGELGTATRAGLYEMGTLWADQLLAEHFTERARLIFGHTPRTGAYLIRKLRLARRGKVEMGGKVDIVFSGRTYRAAMRSRYMVRASDKQVTIPIIGPEYFPARNRRRINMGKELTAVSDRHERLLSAAAERGLQDRISRIRATRIFRTK